MASIAYGVPLEKDAMDIEKPLLEAHDNDETDANSDNKNAVSSQQSNQLLAASFLFGTTLGFCFQCLSLGSDALLATYFDDTTTETTAEATASPSQWTVLAYYGISALSYSWYLLFPLVAVCMTHATSRSAVRWVQINVVLGLERNNDDNDMVVWYTPETRRMTFVAAVCLLEGIVLGCSGSWFLSAYMLELTPVLMGSLSVATLVCLALCQGMIVVYDCFHPSKSV